MEVYDSLYKLGYASDGTMVHYTPVLKTLKNMLARESIRTVLDVGSSHGGGVAAIWNMGLIASGVDVAPTAVKKAAETHGSDPSKCVQRCWTASPATTLPFPDEAFDALISTDVLEHLEETDVERATRELARVTSRWMLLKISNRHEATRMQTTRAPFARGTYTSSARTQFNVTLPRHLHTAVHPQAWWVERFGRVRFVLNSSIPVPGWACCAFVLRRDPLSS